MKKILFLLMSVTLMFAGQCQYEVKKLDVDWEAYKTPLKLGVKGTFDDVVIASTDRSSQDALLNTATITIDTSKINSKNAGRDAKLVKAFFGAQGVKKITVKVASVQKKIINLNITMNNITKTVPMKIDFDNDEVEAEGYIDLADFDMLPSLKSINKACYDLHKGKTWQDVKIKFELETQKHCN